MAAKTTRFAAQDEGLMLNGEGSSQDSESIDPMNGKNKSPVSSVSTRRIHPKGRASRGKNGVTGETSDTVLNNCTLLDGKGSPINGTSTTAERKEKEGKQRYETRSTGDGSEGKENRKRGREPSQSPPRELKRSRRNTPVVPEPCCTECAMHYSTFPRLVCTKADNPDGPCSLCVIGNKRCVPADSQHTGSPVDETEQRLYELQKAAKSYISDKSAKHRSKLNKRQQEWKNLIKAVQKSAIGANPLDEAAHTEFMVGWVSNQKNYGTPAIDTLHQMKDQRSTYELNRGRSVDELKHTNHHHMDVALGHLKGTKASVPCNNCKNQRGLFKDCITVNYASSSKAFKGACTNCAFKKGKDECSHVFARSYSEEL
ncbi:MAG: hypothetical protein Q9180_000234 [Flavoplaca navasiana]